MDHGRTMDEIAFEEQFRPILAADGSWRVFWWNDPTSRAMVDAAEAEGRLWTMLDVDGFTMVSSGRHFVNRLSYVITAVPAPKDEPLSVYDIEEWDDWIAANPELREAYGVMDP